MVRKRSAGVTILAWLIIINSTIALLPLLFLRVLPTNVQKFATIFAVSPEDVIIELSGLLNIYIAISALVCYIFFFLGILWGIGLLRLNNVSRLVVISISLLEIVGVVFSGHLNYRGYGEPAQLYGPKLWFIFSIANFCVNITYVYYLTRSKVKEQFKPGGPDA